VDHRGIFSSHPALSSREGPWERIRFGLNEPSYSNSPQRLRGLLPASKSLRTMICITSGTGFGVEAPVSAEASDCRSVVDITGPDKPPVAPKQRRRRVTRGALYHNSFRVCYVENLARYTDPAEVHHKRIRSPDHAATGLLQEMDTSLRRYL